MTIYKTDFISILTFTPDKQALTNRYNSKIQEMAVKFLRSTEVKTKMEQNYKKKNSEKKRESKNLLTKLEQK